VLKEGVTVTSLGGVLLLREIEGISRWRVDTHLIEDTRSSDRKQFHPLPKGAYPPQKGERKESQKGIGSLFPSL